ncbi:MAG: ATP-dependent Clp protease adapter ClpS [Actinomycetaceae bacterium]|nr:ATP-dependent Clp protease adapter ClpS [Actinomycetaceae bacterium]
MTETLTAPALPKNSHGNWQTVVWNDPINLGSYVVNVFCRHFRISRTAAEALMKKIHTQGSAVVSEGPRERMEADVVTMHGYGLQATLRERND